MAALPNIARRQSFVQSVRSAVVAVLPSTIAAQTVRDETKATSWGRLIHCCAALGYALALCGVDVLVVAWLSTWDWVRRNDNNGVLSGVNNDALALMAFQTASTQSLLTSEAFILANDISRITSVLSCLTDVTQFA